jgi:exodeoxyribonuclease V alpha subunit
LYFQSQQCQVLLAAPTGRAAQRLSEISPVPAKTIHRLLEWSAHENQFLKDATNPLRADVVVIDEASMLDINLASQLLQAIPSTSRLILIGDVDQLPAVGPGNFLSDLLQSKRVPCLQLTEIFRQAASSQIVQIAHAINRGQVPPFENQTESDCLFLPAYSPQEILETIRTLMGKTLKERGFDPVREVQILTPMNRGPLGSLALNQDMQALLNPKPVGTRESDIPRNGFVLRSGDKVIQTVNNYEQNVFNGDIGFVEYTKVEGGKVIVSFQGRNVQYEGEGIQELLLAYAVSIHKSQGSEFPVVIIPVSMQHYIMLQRNLFYTALTRGKKLAIFIGEPKALAHAIHNQDSRKRQTQLSARVQTAV